MASKPWADGPLPLLETPSKTLDVSEHEAIYIANEMAFAHNAMIRGINSIVRQAPYVRETTDVADFLFLITAWCQWVGHHHVLEETMMFPGFEKFVGKGYLDGNVDQHHAFSGGLKTLRHYAEQTQPADYDSPKLLGIIDSFSAKLHEHLKEEITSLLSMKSSKDGPRLLEVYKEAEAEAGKQDKTMIPPLALGCCDKTFEGGNNWPEMPWVGPYFVHYLMARKHAGSWRFLPSDAWRTPRELSFLN